MDFNESQTKQNLAWAFAAECQAGARYQFMATQAQNNQMFFIKDTMKAIAKNEMAHAKLFYDFIFDKSGETKVNYQAEYPYIDVSLENSLLTEKDIEKQEFEEIYPKFAEIAKQEGFDDVSESFKKVAEVENSHSKILAKLASGFKSKSLYKTKSKWAMRCSNCGYLDFTNKGWDKCPLCSLPGGYIQLDFYDVYNECATRNKN